MKALLHRFPALAVASRFRGELGAHRFKLAAIGAASLGVAGLELLRPWTIQWVFDGALIPTGEPPREPFFYIWTGAAAAALIALLRAGLQYRRSVSLAGVGHGVTRSLRYRLFDHLSRLSPTFHARHKSGDLLVRLMGDAPMLSGMLVESSVELVTRVLLVVGTLAVLLAVDPVLTLVLAAVLPLFALVVRWMSGHLTAAVHKQRKKEGHLADFLHEAVAGVQAIQALGRVDHVVHRFARGNRRSARAGLKATRLAARLSAFVESGLGLAVASALLLGSLRVAQGHLTAGELLVFLSYVRSLLKPVRAASKHAERIAKGTACGQRILTVLDEGVAVRAEAHLPPAPPRPRSLRYEDVHFAYGADAPALAGFDGEVRAGELTALVGRSGAGKSTAVALAVRLHDPDSGRVLLDGTPVRELELGSLRERFGVCLQETTLFGESVRENLLLGRPEAGDGELWEALAGAALAERIDALPDGLDTRLGSAGAGLSGGERRRLSLARSLLRRSPILIADEPFAGLDAESAAGVRRTLRAYARDAVVLVISHDAARLDGFDRILFVDRGRVVDAGTHGELLERCELYREVLRLQPGEVPA